MCLGFDKLIEYRAHNYDKHEEEIASKFSNLVAMDSEEMKQQFALKIQKDPEDVACRGCRLQNGCRHFSQPCETLKCVEEKELEFCFECKEFPCVKLQPAKEGADRYPHNFKLFNLCRMKAVGVDKWAEEEAKLIRQRYYLGKFIPGSGPILKR